MLLAAGLAFFFDAVILLVFGEKQRGVPKIVNGVFNWDFRIIMPYDRILVGVPGDRRSSPPSLPSCSTPAPAARCARWRRTGSRRS